VKSLLFLICIACAPLLFAQSPGAGGTPAICSGDCSVETEPFLHAAQLVQPALLNGPNYKVIPEVEVRGYMARFLIDTPYGPMSADSAQLLAIRVAEIPAIEALERASHTGLQ